MFFTKWYRAGHFFVGKMHLDNFPAHIFLFSKIMKHDLIIIAPITHAGVGVGAELSAFRGGWRPTNRGCGGGSHHPGVWDMFGFESHPVYIRNQT